VHEQFHIFINFNFRASLQPFDFPQHVLDTLYQFPLELVNSLKHPSQKKADQNTTGKVSGNGSDKLSHDSSNTAHTADKSNSIVVEVELMDTESSAKEDIENGTTDKTTSADVDIENGTTDKTTSAHVPEDVPVEASKGGSDGGKASCVDSQETASVPDDVVKEDDSKAAGAGAGDGDVGSDERVGERKQGRRGGKRKSLKDRQEARDARAQDVEKARNILLERHADWYNS